MSAFPPYRLLESDHVAMAEEKHDRLARLYHVGQAQAWDGKAVLASLLAKHGGIRVSDEKREAIGHIFSVILWGELAAWSISADIALMLDETEPKMAATSQAFDEARHFYVMRDYLRALGGKLPELDGYTSVILRDLLATHRLTDKLLGMQLIVEVIALTLFRAVAQTGVEPVLCELMPYYERDEARHVGLGVMYLPSLLRQSGRLETTRLQFLQLKIMSLVGWGTHAQQRHFKVLGIDPNAAMKRGMQLNREAFEDMRGVRRGEAPPPAVLMGSDALANFNERAIDVFFPHPDTKLPFWQRSLIGVCQRVAIAGDRFLRIAA